MTSGEQFKDEGNAHFKAKEYSEAIAVYSLGIRVDASNHVLFSNRSACHQARQMWKEALEDGKKAVALAPSFAKGYMHTARAQLQLHAEQDAVATIEAGTEFPAVLSVSPWTMAGKSTPMPALSSSTSVFVISAMLATPLLPTLMATLSPGFTRLAKFILATSARTAPSMSSRVGVSKC